MSMSKEKVKVLSLFFPLHGLYLVSRESLKSSNVQMCWRKAQLAATVVVRMMLFHGSTAKTQDQLGEGGTPDDADDKSAAASLPESVFNGLSLGIRCLMSAAASTATTLCRSHFDRVLDRMIISDDTTPSPPTPPTALKSDVTTQTQQHQYDAPSPDSEKTGSGVRKIPKHAKPMFPKK
eukprot:PhM_4_TR18441/c0_g1_i2/m.72864